MGETSVVFVMNGAMAERVSLPELKSRLGVTASLTLADVISTLYPVGSLKFSADNVNPGTYLSGTTWTAWGSGRVLVGFNSGDTDFDAAEEIGGAKTVASAGAVSAPTFTGSALGTHAHTAGTLVPSSHAGSAVADHAAHTHSVTSNVAVADHAAHTHSVTSNVAVADHASHTHTAASTTAAPKLVTANTSTGVAEVTGGPSATLTHAVTNNAVTSGNPSATLSHAVTNNAVTSGNPSATLTHAVTQPSDHTMSGTSQAVSAGTPAGSVSAPTFTGSATSVVQPYITGFMWKRTA